MDSDTLWRILLQFLFRLSLGVTAAMGATPPRWVPPGFYRVHLWVVMGLNTLAALIAWSRPADWPPRLATTGLAAGLAFVAYVGAVIWLYERRRAGRAALWFAAALSLAAAATASNGAAAGGGAAALALTDIVTGGLLLGATLTAMFLGHWYLNHPGMDLAPLRRLVLLMAAAVVLRAAAGAVGLGLEGGAEKALGWWLMLLLRWSAGLVLTLVLAYLAWQTLQVPNTQSATGILYAAVILTFIGELTAQLLSAEAAYAL